MADWDYKTLTFEYIHEEVKKHAEKSFPMPVDFSSSTHFYLQERKRIIAAKKSFIEHEIPKRIKHEIGRLISQDYAVLGEPDIRGYELDSVNDGKYIFKKRIHDE